MVPWFHPTLAHASSTNLSPFSRITILIASNGISNALSTPSSGPELLVAVPLRPLGDGEAL